MQSQISRNLSSIQVQYTSRPVSGWGGLLAFERFMTKVQVSEFLARGLPDGRSSNNRLDVVEMAKQLLVTVLIGGSRFEHAERIRDDEVIRRMIQANRLGSASSLTRYFGNFQQSQSEHLHVVTSELIFGLLRLVESSDVLDLDSTVFTRWGDQQGSAKGYNPHHRGERSHHPLLGMLARSKVIAHAWLREGSASPHRGCSEFMEELLSRLPEGFRIEGLRADSGFYSRRFLELLEEREIPYAIAAKMSQGFAGWCKSRSDWRRVDATTEIAEGLYESPKTSKKRRFVVIRHTVRRQTEGVLFDLVDYDYRAIVTSKNDDALDIYRFYQKRGDCENRIKELKGDFHADGFCLQHFAGTEAVFRLIVFLFNLVAIFKATVLKDRRITLATIRTKIFVIGAAIGTSARKTILRLGLQGQWRDRFDRLLQAVETCLDSIAAQLTKTLDNPALEAPSCWRYRPKNRLPFALY